MPIVRFSYPSFVADLSNIVPVPLKPSPLGWRSALICLFLLTQLSDQCCDQFSGLLLGESAHAQPRSQSSDSRTTKELTLGELDLANTSSLPRGSFSSPSGFSSPTGFSSAAPQLQERITASLRSAADEDPLRPSPIAKPSDSRLNNPRVVERPGSRLGSIRFPALPRADTVRNGRYIASLANGDIAFLSLDLDLHRYVSELVKKAQSPHIAIVAMEPSTGRILAYGGKSRTIASVVSHAGFPAASLFKVITSAAALERTGLEPDSLVSYRGGTYELERWNYAPDPRRDRRLMSLTDALGRSCNPVFGRVALNYLSTPILRSYAEAFGFNQPLGFEAPLPTSLASIPFDEYHLSRTGAGFGEVFISPVHAAAMMSGVANRGIMPRPTLVEGVLMRGSNTIVPVGAEMKRRMVSPATAAQLMRMMVSTTRTGTSRREFMAKNKRPVLGNIEVAAKTGTLTGKNPKGLNQWFIAAAPLERPKIALAIIAVDPKNISARPSHLGRQIIQRYLK